MERLTAKQAQSMMEAVAAVYEKKEDCVDKDKKTKHNCAKKVCHKEHGEGACIPGKHTLLEDGTVTHYSVVFEHGVEEMIPVEDLEVLVTEMHEHAEMEGEDLQEVDLKALYTDVVNSVTGGGRPPGKTGVGVPRGGPPRGGSASGNAPTPTPSETKPSEPMRGAPARSRSGNVMQNSSATKQMQPASSAPSVKNVEPTSPPKTDKPLATLNRAKRGDGFLGPTVSAGGYRMGIPNPVRKEEVEQVNEGEKPMGQHPGKSPDKATRDKYETQRRRNEAPTGVGVPDKSVGYGQLKQSADLFDIVKGHFIDEGLTEEEALKKMITLTDEERSEIIEGSCGSKKDKKKKGGYGK